MDWARASAATVVCEEKGTTLRDVVQGIMDGAETPDEMMSLLGIENTDECASQIPEILDWHQSHIGRKYLYFHQNQLKYDVG